MWGAAGVGITGSVAAAPPPRRRQPRPQASGNAVASVSLPSAADGAPQAPGTAKGARSAAGATSRMSWQRPGADSCDDEAASQRVAAGRAAAARAAAPGNSNSMGEAVGVIAGGGMGGGTLSAGAEADVFSDGRPASPALSLRRGAASHITGQEPAVRPVVRGMVGGRGVLARGWREGREVRPAASTEAVLEDVHGVCVWFVSGGELLGTASFVCGDIPVHTLALYTPTNNTQMEQRMRWRL